MSTPEWSNFWQTTTVDLSKLVAVNYMATNPKQVIQHLTEVFEAPRITRIDSKELCYSPRNEEKKLMR